MKPYTLTYQPTAITDLPEWQVVQERLVAYQAEIQSCRAYGYDSDYAFLELAFDDTYYQTIMALVARHKQRDPHLMIVIGIGGSNLGTLAIHEALCGRWYNDDSRMAVHYADTVDPSLLHTLIKHMEAVLERGQQVLLVVISKSGTTIETMVNFAVLSEVLRRYQPSTYQESIVAITDEYSDLWQQAQYRGYDCLAIPARVGGRYSVFSAVGLFPLAMCGIDTQQLREGARAAVKDNGTPMAVSDAALLAGLLYIYNKQGYTIADQFIFFPEGESLGKWYRQLMGESLGKEINGNGEVMRTGITPTVSLGTVDLHSVVQLYVAGPQHTFTTFITRDYGYSIPITCAAESKNAVYAGRTVDQVMHAMVAGIQQVYAQRGKPLAHIHLAAVHEYALGYLMQMYMIHIVYLGYLLRINPFDQPQVELYKEEVRKKLIMKY